MVRYMTDKKSCLAFFSLPYILFDRIILVDRRLATVRKFKVLEMTEDISVLADIYFKAMDIPKKARNDAFHLALAVYNGMDYLISWNCTHIAAGRVRSIIESINNEKGFLTPVICTPEELMEV